MNRYITLILKIFVSLAVSTALASQNDIQEQLFTRALKASSCEQTPNNGRICSYRFEKTLEVNIKDVGGADTVVAFRLSDINKELYAVMYFGCVAVVPGIAHPQNYGKEYGVFISPNTGLVYRSIAECKKSL